MQERGLQSSCPGTGRGSMGGGWWGGLCRGKSGVGCLTSYVLRAEQCRRLESSLCSGGTEYLSAVLWRWCCLKVCEYELSCDGVWVKRTPMVGPRQLSPKFVLDEA